MSPPGESELRRIAAERIRTGILSCDPLGHTWGGRGSGESCSLCETRILPADIEYEVERGTGKVPHLYHFHLPCYIAWLNECDHSPQRTAKRA